MQFTINQSIYQSGLIRTGQFAHQENVFAEHITFSFLFWHKSCCTLAASSSPHKNSEMLACTNTSAYSSIEKATSTAKCLQRLCFPSNFLFSLKEKHQHNYISDKGVFLLSSLIPWRIRFIWPTFVIPRSYRKFKNRKRKKEKKKKEVYYKK